MNVTITPPGGVIGPTSGGDTLVLAAKIVKNFEGFRAHPYNDAAHHCTIGYGTKLTDAACTPAIIKQYSKGITKAQATMLLSGALQKFDKLVTEKVKVPLNPSQRAALDSFVYNVGPGAFTGSTLLKLLNKGQYTAAANQLPRWVHANGKVLQGLQNRRSQERNLFLYGTIARRLNQVLRGVFAQNDVTGSANPQASGPGLSVSPHTVTAGQLVNLSGSGWGTGSSCGQATAAALVLGVSPYGISTIGVHLSNGRLSGRWMTSTSIVDSLPWQVTASRHCGNSTRSATAPVTVEAHG